MQEKPVEALRKKRDNSISKCWGLMAAGDVKAVVSAGNTGAMVASALFNAKMFLPGVRRPGIAAIFPSHQGPIVIIDVGANMNATTDQPFVWLAAPGTSYRVTKITCTNASTSLTTAAGGVVIFGAGLRRVTATAAGIATLLEPVTAATLGVLVFGERLGSLGWLGAALLLASLALLTRAGSGGQ